MAYQDVTEAFQLLLSKLDAVLKATNDEAAQASRQGKYERAQRLLTQAQQMGRFITDIQAKQQEL